MMLFHSRSSTAMSAELHGCDTGQARRRLGDAEEFG